MGRKRVLVVGGGFAGLQLIENLDSNLFDVVLIDKVNHHQFQPLFYQVATSQLEPSSISFPLRKIFQDRKGTQIRLAEVTEIFPEKNEVGTSIGNFGYDYLVIASGCGTNFYGNENLEKYTYGLKTTYDAIKIRNRILEGFEEAISMSGLERKSVLNIVIVGGGPTGVEMAGAFAEIKQNILPRDFPDIDFKDLTITLLEGSSHTLNSMSDCAKLASEKYLTDLGVRVKTGLFVKEYDGRDVKLSNGEVILSQNVIWAAGVIGNTIKGIDIESVVGSGRYKVNRQNAILGYSNIYAVGDIAYMETPKYPKGHPQLANVAINQAKNLARNLKRMQNGKTQKDFEYLNLGSMATVGKHKAVVDLPFISFKGYFAWFVWMFLHLMLILSIRNKLIIFINWAWNYFTKDTSLRLILRDPRSQESDKTSLPSS